MLANCLAPKNKQPTVVSAAGWITKAASWHGKRPFSLRIEDLPASWLQSAGTDKAVNDGAIFSTSGFRFGHSTDSIRRHVNEGCWNCRAKDVGWPPRYLEDRNHGCLFRAEGPSATTRLAWSNKLFRETHWAIPCSRVRRSVDIAGESSWPTIHLSSNNNATARWRRELHLLSDSARGRQ